MKNREKYKNELMDVIKTDGRICGFMENHGVPQMLGRDLKNLCEINCVACGTALQLWLDEEYEEPPKPEVDWNKVPVDTPILVRESKDREWKRRYFAKYKDGIIFAWVGGYTSWTALGDTAKWKYAKLAESEEN